LTPKQQAIADLEAARAGLRPHWQALTAAAHPKALVRRSVLQHPAAWAAGSLVAGFLAIRWLLPLKDRKNGRDTPVKSAKTGSLLALLASPLVGMARKAVLTYLTQNLQSYLRNHSSAKNPPPP
jgi:hypothetical protein